MEIRHYLLMGKVQGVGFRFFTRDVARSLKIKGWVKNLPDGNVECLVAGSINDIESFEKKIRKGPPLSRVVNMEKTRIAEGTQDIPDDFEILN